MNDRKKSDSGRSDDPEEPMQGFNLRLAYSLMAFAILAAIAIALFIVMPFYQHR
jgi:hypothetical protein